jgi:DNA (cytosine-5)-methyltransferase 1
MEPYDGISWVNKMKLLELFSGIGSQRKALMNLGIPFESVGICDWNINAIIAYYKLYYTDTPIVLPDRKGILFYLSQYTFSLDGKKPCKLNRIKLTKLQLLYKAHMATHNLGSIHDVDAIPDCDILTYSFPCQDLSRQGKGAGLMEGKQSSLVWEVKRILEHNKLPKVLLMENVPAILTPKFNFDMWKSCVESFGYKNIVFNLSALHCGIPQNRTRTFMVSTLDELPAVDFKHLQLTTNRIESILDDDTSHKPLNISLKSNTIISTKTGLKYINAPELTTFRSEQKVYCIDGIAPTLTATGSNSRIKIIAGNIIRYLSPCECWKLMGFDIYDYNKVKDEFSRCVLVKLAGNSIVVNVLMKVFEKVKHHIIK